MLFGEGMKAERVYKRLVGLITISIISFIPLWGMPGGITPAFSQELRRHAHETGGKEGSMTGVKKFTEEEGKYLLGVARITIEKELFSRKGPELSEADLPDTFREYRGTFVTLTQGGALRGCIGHIVPQETLIEGVRVNAINAAFRDPRFPPLGKDEWKQTKIEVSILTKPQPLSYSGDKDLLNKLRPGVDGVIINKGYHQATFLPQVWEQLPKKEEFLTHLCLKAGLDGEAWRKGDLEVSVYQVQAFEE
jgi:AmmeMemoRadiSam system protein A